MLRALLIYGISSFVILGAFFIFVAAGWPGEASDCLKLTDCSTTDDGAGGCACVNTCFCEAFDAAKAQTNEGGIRQPVNTLSNLYSLFTALFVAIFVGRDRATFSGRPAPNPMRSSSWIPDAYIFAVLFLGLGSMWFHASMKQWGSIFDGLSMYVFAGFLVFYSVTRLIGERWYLWLGYGGVIVLFTLLHGLKAPSVILIAVLVFAYLIFQVILWVRDGRIAFGRATAAVLWCCAAGSMLLATIFWALSATSGPLCNPDSLFQPHGLLWHTLAGVMALLLYLYWREEDFS